MQGQIEQGMWYTDMQRPGCEIHHSRDDYARYAHMVRSQRQPVGLHHHDFYEIFCFLSGDMEYHIEDRRYRLQPGDILTISPSELHQPVFIPAQGFYERIVLWIDQDTVQPLCREQEDLTACFGPAGGVRSNLLRPEKETAALLRMLMDRLIAVPPQESAYGKVTERALLALILAELNLLSLRTLAGTAPETSHRPLSKYTVAAVAYIAAHLNEPIPLQALAKACFVSEQHLLRIFKEEMGMSVHRYITQKRLLTARQHLHNGMPAQQAAQQCGFSSYSTFWRCYKKEYGEAPSGRG